MKEYSLRLFDDWNSSLVNLNLHPLQEKQPLSDVITLPKAKVFFNRKYSAQLMSPSVSDVQRFEMQLNSIVLNTSFSSNSGRIQFYDSFYGARIFNDCFGLSFFTLRFKNSEGWQTLVSERFQVMVEPGSENFSVNAIGDYTASHNSMLLYGTRFDDVTRMPDAREESPSLEDKVRLLKKTAAQLEQALRVLRVSPRTKTTVSAARPSIGSPEVLCAIGRHPERLHRAPAGVGFKAAGQNFILDSTQFASSSQSTDVYENQVILAFIKAICDDICQLLPQLEQAMRQVPMTMISSEEYISSSSFLNAATRTSMSALIDVLSDLQQSYGQLYEHYRHVIPAREIQLAGVPRPTPAFLSLEAYRPIYQAAVRWFGMRSVGVRDLRFIQIFLQITTLYEVYVLTKLQQFLLDQGFTLRSSWRQVYAFDWQSLYENTPINNVFEFEKDELKITLFYQPVLYDNRHEHSSPVGLYRNTSLSFPRNWGESARGSYYTPDYILRIGHRRASGAQYVLADAKYANLSNVRDFKTIPLVYKYLFSLTPENPADEITGLYIFQGKNAALNTTPQLLHSIYDLADDPRQVFPQVEIVSLYEYPGTSQKEQFEALAILLDAQIERLMQHVHTPSGPLSAPLLSSAGAPALSS